MNSDVIALITAALSTVLTQAQNPDILEPLKIGCVVLLVPVSNRLFYHRHVMLLFPEPLPTLTLINRSQLLRGRVDSNASDIQFLRAVQGHLRPDNRRTGDHPDPIRDAIGSISHYPSIQWRPHSCHS